jgi:hypothetical protein
VGGAGSSHVCSRRKAMMSRMETDVALTIAENLEAEHILICAVVSKNWHEMLSSQQIWRNLCYRKCNGATLLIAGFHDGAKKVCWGNTYVRLRSLFAFNQPAQPRIEANAIDPGSLEALVETRLVESQDERNDPVVLKICRFELIEEESEVQPMQRTCVLRGDADTVDDLLLRQLTPNRVLGG